MNDTGETHHCTLRRAWVPVLLTVFVLAVVVGNVTARAALPQQSGSVDLLAQPNLQIDGAGVGDEAGASVAAAGDVNGDGTRT